MKKCKPSIKTKTFVIALAVSAIIPANAQNVEENTPLLEEILVTATRRAESIQDVPVSVTSISADQMTKLGAFDIADLAAYVPNFEFSDASILPNLYVRGIGSGTTHSIEQSVGRFIDDVYIGRAAINLHQLLDVANVEVLRGPQGTLFGKNTIAGALIINTGDPTSDFDAGLTTSISEFSTTGGNTAVEGFISGPLSDTVRGRLAASYKDRDGYIENNLDGPDGGTRQDLGLRAKLEWDLSDKTTVGFKAEYFDYDEEGQTSIEAVASGAPIQGFQGVPGGPNFPPFAFVGDIGPGDPNFSFDRDFVSSLDCTVALGPLQETFCPERDQTTTNVTLTVDHEFAAGTLTSITAYQEYDYVHQFVAVDLGARGGAFRATRDEEYSGFTQEFRFTSNESDKYDYIIGAYFEDSDVERIQRNDVSTFALLGLSVPPPQFIGIPFLPNPLFGRYDSTQEDWVQGTQSAALFGQVRYRFNDEWTAIVGGRFGYEEKDFNFISRRVLYQDDLVNPVGGFINEFPRTVDQDPFGNDFTDERDESRFTPSVTIRYQPSDDLNFYATIAQGHKTGGFSDRFQDDVTFDEEINTSIELGVKAVLLDGALRTNLALFSMDIEDLQVARSVAGSGGPEFVVLNAAEATSEGAEFDFIWDLSDKFSLGGNLALTDATYDDFPGGTPIGVACPVEGGFVDADGSCNFAGLPLIFAPDVKGGLFAEANFNVASDWELSTRLDVNYSSEHFLELEYQEVLKQDDVTTVNGSVSVSSADGKYGFSLIGRNLTEEHILGWGLRAGPTSFVTPKPSREIALQFTYRY